MTSIAHDSTIAGPRQALRVTVAYEGASLRVVDRRVIRMRVPGSDPVDHGLPQTGFWFQVEDRTGTPVYRRFMENPIRIDVETPTGDAERPLHRERLERPSGVFFLLVPLQGRAERVRIFASPLDPKRAGRAIEVLTFPVFAEETGEPSAT